MKKKELQIEMEETDIQDELKKQLKEIELHEMKMQLKKEELQDEMKKKEQHNLNL